MPVRLVVVLTLLALATAGISTPRQATQERLEDAYRANNIGVAWLEQYKYDDAVSSFRRALELQPALHIAQLNLAIALLYAGQTDAALTAAITAAGQLPALPNPQYVIGLAARAQGRTDDAAVAFRRVLQVDAADVGSRVGLGQLHLQQRQYMEAAGFFRDALSTEPFNVTAAYGLATALTRAGDSEGATRAMKTFESLREAPYGITYSQTYLQQGRYGEALASTGSEPELVDPSTPKVSFADNTSEVFPSQPAAGRESRSTLGGSVSLADFDGDGDLDAFATSGSSQSQRFYLNDVGRFSDATARAGLSPRSTPAAHAALPADYDNDGKLDLLLLRPGGARLLRQREGGSFEDVTDAAGVRSTPDLAVSAAFVDVDHDGDLDIFIAGGARSADGADRPAPNQLLQNNGKGTFVDITRTAGLLDGEMRGIAIAPTDFDDRRDIDLVVLGSSGAPRLFKNMRDGSFKDVAADAGLPRAASYSALAAADVDKNGRTDFVFGRPDATGTFVTSDLHGRFTPTAGPEIPAGVTVAQFLDYDNDGLLDLFTASRRSVQLFRNLGQRWSNLAETAGLTRLAASLTADIDSVAFGDVDRDGDLDAVVLLASGEVRCWRNQGGSARKALQVRLAGRVSNRGGVGSKVELRAGSLRQRVETSAVTPALGPPEIAFGLGARQAADVVRVLWPSGTLQAEVAGDAPMLVTELDRKPSSCPYLYVWNGSRFEFVTDFMGGGEVGYWMAPGVWNTPDPDEYVRIAPGRLQPRDGRYEIRVTNELEEALFVDHLQLVAIDHHADVGVFPNEGLGAVGAGHFPPTTVRTPRAPVSAVDGHGRDVLSRLRALDRQYVDEFPLLNIRGYAEPHELQFDIGPGSANVVLLATGWTDYAFSGDNVAAHQRGLTLNPPVLEVRSAREEWRPLGTMGIPVGRPQTLVVDLRKKLRPGERQMRIRTNMRIYWDQILVDHSGGNLPITVTRLDPVGADLRWRGFSTEMSPDGRQPFTYDYERVSRISPWKTMLGSYTREGDVRELLKRVDDMFVISRPGDEIVLAFDETALPTLAPGQSRTFLLFADGFSKEMDIASASPHTVEPLPFHGMRSYPYGADERYPATKAHLEYRSRYNTRVVSRSVPPLEISATGR